MIIVGNEKVNISTQTSTQVYTGPCVLKNVILGTTAAGSITIIDGITDGGTVVAILKSNIVENTYMYNIVMANGIRIITAAASNVCVTYAV
jgi:hypothetical protein